MTERSYWHSLPFLKVKISILRNFTTFYCLLIFLFPVECFCQGTNHKEFWPKEAAKQNPQFRIYLGTRASTFLPSEIHWNEIIREIQCWQIPRKQSPQFAGKQGGLCSRLLVVCIWCDLSGKAASCLKRSNFELELTNFTEPTLGRRICDTSMQATIWPFKLHLLNIFLWQFLSDPGKPAGVRSLGPYVRLSVTFCRLYWCDSGWWRYQLDTDW